MHPELDVLASRQRNLVTRWQLVDLGLSRSAIRHQLSSGRLHVVLADVYRLAGVVLDWRTKLQAAVLAAGEDAVVSHQAAAALLRLPGFGERPIELTVPYNRVLALRGVTIHRARRLPVEHTKLVDGLRTTSMARTLCDLAGTIHPLRTARALDNGITRGGVTITAIWRVLDDLPAQGRRGTATMRQLLLARGDGYIAPASELEHRFMQIIRDGGLPDPDREADVGDREGWVGRVEFAYRDARVLIEVDSRLHHTSLIDLESDRTRDNRLMAVGWRVLRITWVMLTERPHDIVSLVKDALRAAAA